MHRLATLVVMTSSLTAAAQFTIRTSASSTDTEYAFGASDCSTTLTLVWTVTGALGGVTNGNMKLWATSASSCADAPTSDDLSFDDVTPSTYLLTTTGTFTVTPSSFPGFATTACGGADLSVTTRICGAYTYLASTYSSTTSVAQASPLALVYDTKPPSAPSITAVSAYDGTARITFSANSDVTSISAQVRGPDDADFTTRATVDSSVTLIKVTGLTNGVEYQLRLFGADAAGNESEPSEAISATSKQTSGFYGVYLDAGGTDAGGCSAAGGLIPLLVVLLLRRAISRSP